MKVKILDTKAREFYFENKFYVTGIELEMPFSTAVRLNRITKLEYIYDKQDYDASLFHNDKKFGFTSDIDLVSGWGNVSYNLLKYSKDFLISLTGRTLNVKDRDIYKMANRAIEESGAMVWHEQPKDTWLLTPFAKNIAIVPFETTIIPKSWIERINHFDALFVPCQQNVDAFKASGVKVPIEIIHWGIDTDAFRVVERPQRDIFTFGHMGSLSIRKGTDVLIDAFREAFPIHLYPDVRLICKTSNPHYPFMVKDKRIIVQMQAIEHEELMDTFFKEIDCFVFPTRGEGVGLPFLEAASTGVPVIVTNWSGPVDYMSDDMGWKLNYSLVPAKDFTQHVYKEECGEWAEPDKEHLKELMMHCYTHQDEVREKGKSAAAYIRANFTWAKTIIEFHHALSKHL